MISIGSTEVTTIYVGSSTPTNVYVGSTTVWPTEFYYTLTLKSRNYSSSGNTVHSTGNDYVTFTCEYKKFRSDNDSLVSTQEVTATPGAVTYFTVTQYNQVKYDYTNYKNHALETGDYNVSLSYGNVVIYTTFAFAGNSYTMESSISDIVPDTSVVPAYGGVISYTGGEVTDYKHWTSGYREEYGNTRKATWGYAYNSLISNLDAYIIEYNNTIYVPSMTNNTCNSTSTYTFTSNTYNGTSKTFTLTQSKNQYTQSHSRDIYDVTHGQVIDGVYNPSVEGETLKFQVQDNTTTTWDSSYQSSSVSVLDGNDYTVTYQAYSNGGCVTGVSRYSTNVYEAYIAANSTSYMKISGIICTSNSQSWTVDFILQQPQYSADTYSLSVSTQSISIGSTAGSTSFTVTSTKNGSAFTPTISFASNNIGGTISTTSSGSTWTVTVSYGANNTSNTRSASISIVQQGTNGQSKSVTITQAAAGNAAFDGINIYDTWNDWVVGTVESGDAKGLIFAKNSALTSDEVVSCTTIAFQWQPTPTVAPYSFTYNDFTQTIPAGSTITLGGRTYYGSLLISSDFSSPGAIRPAMQINQVFNFEVE